jgi:hypothetical protein
MLRSVLVLATALALCVPAVSSASAAIVVVKKTFISNGFGVGFGGFDGGCTFVKKTVVSDFGGAISKSVRVCRSGF